MRLANVEPAPSLELFISGTQWIDAFPGRLASHVDRLANLLAEEEGRAPGAAAAGEGRAEPRKLPKWVLPIGAAAAVLLVLGAGIAFWPAHEQISDSSERADPSLDTKPVWLPKQNTAPQQQMAAVQVPAPALKSEQQAAGIQPGEFEDVTVEGALERPTGRALGLNPQGASDEDFQTCEKASGDQGIAACDRAIAGGKFTGRNLSYLYNDRGFLRMQKGELDQALVDLDEAIRIDASNFFALWNRGAVYGAKSDFARAQEDFTKALALNPDDTTKAKIDEALNAVTASAKAANSQTSDPSVISDPSVFWGQEEGAGASASSSYPADAAMPAAPSTEAMPAIPAAPPPMPDQ